MPPPGFLPVLDFHLVERSGIDLHPAEPLPVNGFDDAVEVVVVIEAVGGVVGKYAQRLIEGRPPDGIIAAQLDVAVIVVGIVDPSHRGHGVGPGGTVGVGARHPRFGRDVSQVVVVGQVGPGTPGPPADLLPLLIEPVQIVVGKIFLVVANGVLAPSQVAVVVEVVLHAQQVRGAPLGCGNSSALPTNTRLS